MSAEWARRGADEAASSASPKHSTITSCIAWTVMAGGGTKVSAASPMARRRVARAMEQNSRISSEAISSALAASLGSRVGPNGAMSMGSATSLHMLSMTRAALRFMSWRRSTRDRVRMGTMMARVGWSIWVTKVVARSLSMVFSVRPTSPMVLITSGTRGKMSGLAITRQAWAMASRAALETCFLVSERQSETAGTMSTRQAPTESRCASARNMRHRSDPSLTVQSLCLSAVKRAGRRGRTQSGDTIFITVSVRAAVASRTSLERSLKHS
mmetsp:Transcript_244/g.525  ORF Transcript_244/g.525 Transcript_244/m.525 type:complete len:270 (-) Transcript_244:313-1122(-)